MKLRTILITAVIISSLTPVFSHAQVTDLVSGAQNVVDALDKIKSTKNLINSVPTVPVKDIGLNAKETGIELKIPFTSIKIPLGVSWNELAVNVGKKVVSRVVDSTVDWMQSGFDGNPAYVTNPGSYFGEIANGVVGDELDRISKGALCTPFQAKITIALKRAYTGAPYSPQCRLTDAVKNYESFMNKFSDGGWDAWFEITQNASNNPYGAFANAQLTINNKVEAEINSATKELTWGSGFKSQKACKKRNLTAEEVQKWYNQHPGVEGYPPGYDPKKGSCIEYGDVQTPGATIKAHLDDVLPGSTYIKQITTADQFDKLLTALGQGLLKRFVFKQGGLLGKATESDGNGSNSSGGSSVPQVAVTCFAMQERGTAGETKISWSVTDASDGSTKQEYTWKDNYSAEDGSVSGQTGSSATVTYNTPGKKSASVVATITRLDDFGQPVDKGVTQTFSCDNSVDISKYHPLQISCVADTSRISMPKGVDVSVPVTWKAVVSGGSGTYQYVIWDGDQQVPPEKSRNDNKIFPYELTQVQSNQPKLNWCYSTPVETRIASHTGLECDKIAAGGVRDSVTIQSLAKDPTSTPTNPVFNLGLSRVYFKDRKSNLGSVKANVTVWDADTMLEPIRNFECPAVPVLDY